MQQVTSIMKKELITGKMEAVMAVRIFCRQRSRPKMRTACIQARDRIEGARGLGKGKLNREKGQEIRQYMGTLTKPLFAYFLSVRPS
jgi:hypothetical protein